MILIPFFYRTAAHCARVHIFPPWAPSCSIAIIHSFCVLRYLTPSSLKKNESIVLLKYISNAQQCNLKLRTMLIAFCCGDGEFLDNFVKMSNGIPLTHFTKNVRVLFFVVLKFAICFALLSTEQFTGHFVNYLSIMDATSIHFMIPLIRRKVKWKKRTSREHKRKRGHGTLRIALY